MREGRKVGIKKKGSGLERSREEGRGMREGT